MFTKVQFLLQKSFCTRSFNQKEGSAIDAVAMLDQIDAEWNYCRTLGHELMNKVIDSQVEGIRLIRRIEQGISTSQQRASLYAKDSELRFALKLAEISQMIDDREDVACHVVDLLQLIESKSVPKFFVKGLLAVIKPVLKSKWFLKF